MAITLDQLTRSNVPKPPIMTIYGIAGVGKSTLAANASNPVFAITEDGLGVLDVPHFPIARSYESVMDIVEFLYNEEHDFKTFVLDSLDWFEPLVQAKACRDNGWSSIEEPGYGKGYVAALTLWRQYIEGVNALRDARGMTIIQIAHADVKRFDSPEHDPYDRYGIKLHTRAAALIQEHSDIILFANYRISTIKADVGFSKKVNRAVGSGERVLYTSERPAFLAKNRYGLPDVLPMDWVEFIKAMPVSIQPVITAATLSNQTKKAS